MAQYMPGWTAARNLNHGMAEAAIFDSRTGGDLSQSKGKGGRM